MFIYHYTSFSGLKGILSDEKKEKMKLWFSDYRCLNDYSEGQELQHIYDDVCINLYKNSKVDDNGYKLLSSVSFSDKDLFPYTTLDNGESVMHFYVGDSEKYVCCFSNSDDSLDMWRYYSKNDTGCCLYIMKNKLAECLKFNYFDANETRIGTFMLNPVIYEDTQKYHIVERLLRDQINEDREINDSFVRKLKTKILDYRLCFKNICFKTEDETRGIICLPKENNKSNKETLEKKHRKKDDFEIPYVECELPKTVLRKVLVSPMATDKEYKDIISFVKDYMNDDRIVIDKSQLPVRY